ncbi:MAG: exodeoxyribonuclease VII large subunit [Ancrocorticia sp.]|nr:exodeoxyribonuclease VII large subunit [Ancrocorticia sp.]MCI2178064.1 exodeoxyribonuclease VII large subunit [Ancrocorticia sp.]MCI2193871.1 exodeoxyribonuclease VII large subunit [Ancrocorticia sp.]
MRKVPSRIAVPPELPQRAALTTPEQPWPLRLLSAKVKEYIAAMSRLWVEGEVITLQRRPGAKVQFFTLRDLEAPTSMTVKILSHLLPPAVESGSRVVVCAKPDFYEGNGSLSLWADDVRPIGLGDILARIEQLKARLAAEGLFASERKKPLPYVPGVIGLICGRNTKAKEDVVTNARLRWPQARFDIKEVPVQGAEAVVAMIAALCELDTSPAVDVIVFARGGGSVEDLLPFSDERLIRAVAAAHTPIVSAIGHEGDNPLLDFVADLRASTPTDAAKRIVPDVSEELRGLTQALHRGRSALTARINAAQGDLDALLGRPAMARPEAMIEVREHDVSSLRSWAGAYINKTVTAAAADIATLTTSLRALSPLSTLNRGYSILLSESGAIVSSQSEVSQGESLQAVLRDGRLTVRVQAKESTDEPQ